MARHRISKLILLPLLLASLSGCQIGDSPSLSDSSVANADRYDSPDVSVASLEADGCMAFEDMYFARGEEKDHAFRFKDGKITEHVTCPKVKFNKENYEKLPGKPFFEVIQKIGIPHFRGEEATHSVSYLCKDGNERSLSLSLDAESRWTVSVVKEKEIIYHLKNFVDRESSYKPSLERCKKIRMGMYLSDVLFILGRPLQNTDSNGVTNCWEISSGGTIHIMQPSASSEATLTPGESYLSAFATDESDRLGESPIWQPESDASKSGRRISLLIRWHAIVRPGTYAVVPAKYIIACSAELPVKYYVRV